MNVVTPTFGPTSLRVDAKSAQLQRCHTATSGDRSPSELSVTRHRQTQLSGGGIMSTANPNLSVIEVETRLRERLNTKYQDILEAFQTYDTDHNLTVSRGQFRRVLEVHCLPMTTQQFDAVANKVGTDRHGTVHYCNFLDKFCDQDKRPPSANIWKRPPSRCESAASGAANIDSKTDALELMFREKIQSRLQEILSALRFYDYNHDGTILRHDLHRVLDQHCFVSSDKQFDRIYKRYDFRHNGTVNYRDFLTRLGVLLERPGTGSQPRGSVVVGSRPGTANNPTIGVGQKVKNEVITDGELYNIEVDFRKKMRDNHANLKRMFLAFDRHLDGFISVEDLRSILNNFTLPMADNVFSELMACFGIKASGKISWEFFLNKFQDPLADRNGQTLPIKPSHKFFPGRGTDEKLEFEEVVNLLFNHIKNGYSTLKSAFLELDKNRNGTISHREFRELLETTFNFRLSPDHFQQLMLVLDPHNTNSISYHKFLKLFEERESLAGHKWLTSCHHFNTPKPAIMAWSTLEDNIRDKIELNRADVVTYLDKRVVNRRGRVSLKVLRRVIEKFVEFTLSDEHFNNLINRLVSPDDSRMVDYADFFSKLGVILKPNDTQGISAQIIDNSNLAAEVHLSDQQCRSDEINQRAMDRSQQMEIDEILVRLKDKMAQRSSDLFRAFQYYARKHHDRITRNDFRKILSKFGFIVSDEQFCDICSQLSFSNGQMRFSDFLHNFEIHRPWAATASNRRSNHRVNEIRGDELGLPAEEVEIRLRVKLRDNFEDLREAFHKFDDDNNGILTKRNFRRMLDTFVLIVTDEEFEKFCQRLGINSNSRITYNDFLNVFQVRETQDGHRWLNSTHRYNQTKPTPALSADKAQDLMVQKMHEIWHDLVKAFRSMSSHHQPVIKKSELRQALNRYMLNLNNAEFNSLWARLDADGKGYISYDDFAQRVMAEEFTPGDDGGISRKIIDENSQELKSRHIDQIRRLEENQMNEAHHVTALSTDDILTQLRNYIQDQFTDLQAAFRSFDKTGKGFITSRDIQNLLGQINTLVDDDQLFDLFNRLGLETSKDRLTFDRFVSLFEEGKTESFKLGKLEDVEYPQVKFASLPGNEVEAKFRTKVAEQYDVLCSACKSFDKQQTGLISTDDLRRVLDNFCFKMTNDHFKHIMQSYSNTPVPYSAATIDYVRFLGVFRDKDDKDLQKMMDSLQQFVAISGCRTSEELQALVCEKVVGNITVITQAFSDIDFAGLGVVSKKDFHAVINAHALMMNDEQFDKLCPVLPINEFSNVDYPSFLKHCTTEKMPKTNLLERPGTSSSCRLRTPLTSALTRRPGTACSVISRCGSAMSRRSFERPFTPLVNAEHTEAKVRDAVRKQWKNFQRDCRKLDVDNLGQISQQDFRQLAENYKFHLSDDEFFKLLIKYDLRNDNSFCYTDFLRHFVLDTDSQSARTYRAVPTSRSLLRRSSSAPNRIDHFQTQSEMVETALEQIRGCIISNWKQMRRELNNSAPNGLASAIQFRQALRNINADLSEEEFSSIVAFFEHHTHGGKVQYDDFFRYFLQT